MKTYIDKTIKQTYLIALSLARCSFDLNLKKKKKRKDKKEKTKKTKKTNKLRNPPIPSKYEVNNFFFYLI